MGASSLIQITSEIETQTISRISFDRQAMMIGTKQMRV